jgi:hypothetical protein
VMGGAARSNCDSSGSSALRSAQAVAEWSRQPGSRLREVRWVVRKVPGDAPTFNLREPLDLPLRQDQRPGLVFAAKLGGEDRNSGRRGRRHLNGCSEGRDAANGQKRAPLRSIEAPETTDEAVNIAGLFESWRW